jgi:hypothetical protein
MFGVGLRWSERGQSGLSVVAQRWQARRCWGRRRSGEAEEEEEKGVLHGGVLLL